MNQMQNHQNGQQEQQSNPRDELDMYSQILHQSGNNPLLKNTNLGVGNYDDQYLWQQIRSYRKGMYAYIAFGRILSQRAIHETKVKLGREGFRHYNEKTGEPQVWEGIDEDDVDEKKSSWTVERERGEEIWRSIGDARKPMTEKQAAAIMEKANIDDEWLPIYWEMVSGRHEASRSRDAELLRDMLTGIKHLRGDSDDEAAAGLLGGA